MRFSTDAEVYDQAYHWTRRAVRASLGTTTGCVLLAILAKEPTKGPAFGPVCIIDIDGLVYTRVRRHGKWSKAIQCIGTVEAVRDNMRRLADHCKLSDNERIEMFTELRKWVEKDFRAKSEI